MICRNSYGYRNYPEFNIKEQEKRNIEVQRNINIFPKNAEYGQSYVPIQTIKRVFEPSSGLKNGTIFPELVSPYCPGDSMKEIKYLEASNTIREGCNKCR